MGPGVRRDDAERLSPQSPIQFSKSPVVIASEAIQGHAYDSGLLRFARNDGADQDTHLHSRGTKCPSCWKQLALEMTEGAGKAGCPPHPWSACRKKHAAEPQVGGSSGLPCAMVLRLIRDLPGDHAWLPPSPVRRLKRLHDLRLAPASERQNHTTSPYAAASFVRAMIAPDTAASIASPALRP